MDENEFILADRIAKIKSINELYDLENNAYLSLSGGKDSTVLSFLLDDALPNNSIPRLFLNTGIEYRDIYVKEWAEKDKRIVVFNVGKNIIKTLNKVGYPFKSKEHSEKLYNFKKGYRNKSTLQYFKILPGGYRPCPDKLLCQLKDDYKLNISSQCCNEFKKKPANEWAKENHKLITITGMRREEGGNRINLSCIVADKDNKLKKFHPLAVVDESWIDWYVKNKNIKLCKLYYPPFNFKRTGCKGCPFNMELEKDLFLLENLLPSERKQCETIWEPVYDEYRRLNYRLNNYLLFN